MINMDWYPTPRYILRKNLVLKALTNYQLQNKSILEIGYGSGDFLCEFAKKGMVVSGFDFSKQARDYAEDLSSRQGLNIYFYNSLSEINEKYDYLAAFEVLEHIKEDADELRKWSGYIKDEGILLLSVPSRMKKWSISDDWAGHYRRYEKNDIENKLRAAGYSIQILWSYPFPANLLLDLLQKKEKGSLNTKKCKEEASKESGIVRKSNLLLRMLSNRVVLAPASILQRVFINSDLGSGYIIVAKKQVKGSSINIE